MTREQDDRPAPEISAVITCYYEENTIDEFYGRLSKTLESMGRPYEIIIVNDGSTDATFERLKAIFQRDPHVSAVMDFFRNAGQLRAWTAGICQARGKVVLLMDSDLQLAPEELPLLMEEYDKGYDVVSGYRKDRKDSLFRIFPSKLANMIMRRASQTDLSDFGCSIKLDNADLLRAFELGPFKPFATASIISRAGRWKEVPVSHSQRPHGESGWTFKKLWEFNMENVVSFLDKPFQVIAGVCAVAALLLLLRLGIEIFTPISVIGTVTNALLLYATTISLLIIASLLCLTGEFVIRSFKASQRLPAYIVREKLGR